MVWGKAFMPPPWSNAFDTLGQYPPGIRNPKEKHSRRRVKRHQKRRWSPVKFLFAACVSVCMFAYVCVQSHPHAMIIHCVMYVCVFEAPKPEWWGVKSGVSASQPPPVLFPQIPLFSTSPSVSPPQPPPPHLSLSDSDLAIAHFTLLPPCQSFSPLLLVFLTLSTSLITSLHPSLCLSSSLSLGQFCVIKSMVALLVRQLCQIKNWFLRLIPCTGWMLSPSSSPSLFYSLSFHALPTSYWCSICSSAASSRSHLCCAIKSSGVIPQPHSLPTYNKSAFIWDFVAGRLLLQNMPFALSIHAF